MSCRKEGWVMVKMFGKRMQSGRWEKPGLRMALFICLLLVWSLGQRQYQQYLQASLSQKVIRFHVLANSDDAVDQRVKLEVRDAVGAYVEALLQNSQSVEETRSIIGKNLKGITRQANRVLEREGMAYSARAKLTVCDFPVKEYEQVRFPAGSYEAVQVLLGQGKGHNWWCVMYPNLCFSASAKKEHKKAWKRFARSLTPEEWELVFQKKKYHIRWKFLEYLSKKR